MKVKLPFKNQQLKNFLKILGKEKLSYIILPSILFLIVLVLYTLTLPNVNTGYADSDEFLTAAKVFGVPHPPGYPLYTFLSAIFGRIPLPLTFAGRINFLSVILHALTVILIYFSSLLLFGKFIKDKGVLLIGAFVGSMSLAVMFSFWFYGLFAEVFPLNNFFAALTVLVLLIWSTNYSSINIKKKKILKDPFEKILLGAAFIFGLGLSNQQVIVLLFPMILFWVVINRPKAITDWPLIIKALVLFVVGFLGPYIYPLIASRHLPVINWENVQNFNGIYRLVARRIYAEAASNGMAYTTYQFSVSQFIKGLHSYGAYLFINYGWTWLVVAALGLIFLLVKKQFKLISFISLGVIGGGLFFAIYAPITTSSEHPYYNVVLGIYERFFLLSPLFISMFITIGVIGILLFFKRLSDKLIIIPLLAILFIIINSTVSDYKELKRNNFNLGHSFATTLLKSLPPKSILICFSEHTCFTANYVQQAEGLRPDVTIIAADYSQMPIEEIRIKYPDLIKTTTNRVSLRRSIILNRDLIRWQMGKRPVYIAGVTTDNTILSSMGVDGDPYYLIPEGCALRVSKTFSIPKKQNTCLSVENEYLNSYTTSRAPIAYMFSGYLLYQRYLNGLLFSERVCNKSALAEFRRGLVIYPQYSQLRQLIEKVKRVPEYPDCKGVTQEVTLDDVMQLEKTAESKKDIQNMIYYQAEATVINPKDVNLRLQLAKMYIRINAYENALVEYNDILALQPDNKEAYQNYYKVKEAIDLGIELPP